LSETLSLLDWADALALDVVYDVSDDDGGSSFLFSAAPLVEDRRPNEKPNAKAARPTTAVVW
jgi:hypothetical protein